MVKIFKGINRERIVDEAVAVLSGNDGYDVNLFSFGGDTISYNQLKKIRDDFRTKFFGYNIHLKIVNKKRTIKIYLMKQVGPFKFYYKTTSKDMVVPLRIFGHKCSSVREVDREFDRYMTGKNEREREEEKNRIYRTINFKSME